MINQKKILIIEFSNYENYPIGGHSTFVFNLMQAFGNDLILVGITTDKNDPVGKWIKKEIRGTVYDFFAIAKYNKASTKHLIPDRLAIYCLLKFYKNKILSKNIDNIFIQRPEVLFAIESFNYKNICFRSAGMENPLSVSKFWYSKYFAQLFDKYFFYCFKEINTFLATGDEQAIQGFLLRSNNKIKRSSVIKFPTRIDTSIFKPIDKEIARTKLNIPTSQTLILSIGRLGWLKGWKFLIDSFEAFQKIMPHSVLYFIGEGEDYQEIENYITSKSFTSKIKLVGGKNSNEISLFLNASDLFVMGSYKEGWSTTLLEAMSCGVPTCVTNFSSAKEITIEGVSGFVEKHDIPLFVEKMVTSLQLDREKLPILSEVKKYAVSELRDDLLKHWQLI